MNTIENFWAQVKKHMRKNWPNPPPRRHDDDLWKLVQDAWDAMAGKKRSVKRLVDSMPTRLQNVIELLGRWTKYWIFNFNFLYLLWQTPVSSFVYAKKDIFVKNKASFLSIYIYNK